MVEERNWVFARCESKTFAWWNKKREKRVAKTRRRAKEGEGGEKGARRVDARCLMRGDGARCARSRSVKIHPWLVPLAAAYRCLPAAALLSKSQEKRYRDASQEAEESVTLVRAVSVLSRLRSTRIERSRRIRRDRFPSISRVNFEHPPPSRTGLISSTIRATSSATVSTGVQQLIIFLARISCSSPRFFSIGSKRQRKGASVSGDFTLYQS